MTKFNKSLLTAAVVGALALPGIASAASLSYTAAAPGVQTTYAWELFTHDGITIKTPGGLGLIAQEFDNANLGTISAGDRLRVKITLTNGAKFDTGIAAATFVGGFTEGTQTGGTPNPLAGAADQQYSLSGHELNFTYQVSGNGDTTQTTPAAITAGAYLLGISTVQLNSLVQGLRDGSSVGMEITVQDASNVQVFAASATIARSAHGVTVSGTGLTGDTTKYIDVAAQPTRRALFGTATPGSSAGLAPAVRNTFNAGSVTLDITRINKTRENLDPATSHVNNYDPTVAPGVYNVVNTATIDIRVKGANLAPFAGNRAWLETGTDCGVATAANRLNGTVSAAGDTITFSSSASAARWGNLTSATPGAVTHAVCLSAGGGPISPQALSGEVDIKYNLPTQRNDLPTKFFTLLPLRENGSTLYFQNVNPGANATAQSFLRLTNNNSIDCPVILDAKDDAGLHTSSISLNVPKHASVHVNSDDLENGNAAKGLTGAWGDGTGRWFVRVTADCTNFWGSALNRNSTTGVVTNLTHDEGVGAHWNTPAEKL